MVMVPAPDSNTNPNRRAGCRRPFLFPLLLINHIGAQFLRTGAFANLYICQDIHLAVRNRHDVLVLVNLGYRLV